ncbi:MAG: alanine dehydrogenase [Deferribacteres bacterium]|nr:alanine dehydrogenase [candidate division KSB1 bacterium]MCB9501316.1 alanine dehydrogenase [Deferribacteres bacterium]
MRIAIIKEKSIEENRVAITPAGVNALVKSGLEIIIEEGAGVGCGFSDDTYFIAGAKHAADFQEALDFADVIVKVLPPNDEEAIHLRSNHVLFSFNQLSLRTRRSVDSLLKNRVNSMGIELILSPNKSNPVLVAISELAGKMLPQIAGRYLESTSGGRGIVLSGGPGVPSANVVILGAGAVGLSAAKCFLGLGCQVHILDRNIEALRTVDRAFDGRVITLPATPLDIEKTARFADVLIGAVHISGEQTPRIVSRKVVREMKAGAVIIDMSVDQGGCFETSKPTTLSDPVYIEHDVIHYCVPNILSCVARSASHVLNQVVLEIVRDIAARGFEDTLRENSHYQHGLLTYNGICTNQGLANMLGISSVIPASLIVSSSRN